MIDDSLLKYRLDPWDYFHISKIPDYKEVIWDDITAYENAGELNWIYDKYEVSVRLTEYPAIILPHKIKEYPVFVKPRINLEGMGVGARLVEKASELPGEGYIACKYFTGQHVSTDFVFKNGVIIDRYSFIGHKNKKGSFVLWESINRIFPNVELRLEGLINTGVVNCEHINGNIIEVHLRPGGGYYDISSTFYDQLPGLIKEGKWNKVPFVKSYSKVYRIGKDCYIKYVGDNIKSKNLSSINFTWYDNEPLSIQENDMYSYRYMFINGYDLDEIKKVGNKVLKNMIFFSVEKGKNMVGKLPQHVLDMIVKQYEKAVKEKNHEDIKRLESQFGIMRPDRNMEKAQKESERQSRILHS